MLRTLFSLGLLFIIWIIVVIVLGETLDITVFLYFDQAGEFRFPQLNYSILGPAKTPAIRITEALCFCQKFLGPRRQMICNQRVFYSAQTHALGIDASQLLSSTHYFFPCYLAFTDYWLRLWRGIYWTVSMSCRLTLVPMALKIETQSCEVSSTHFPGYSILVHSTA